MLMPSKLMLISTDAGDLLSDTISHQRGFAIKLLDVLGALLPGSKDVTMKDFALANGMAHPIPGRKPFLVNLKNALHQARPDRDHREGDILGFRTIEKWPSALDPLRSHGVRSAIISRSHLVEARVRLDNMIRGLCATFGYRPGAGQGKAFLERIMQAVHIPGLGDAITSLLSVRTELVEQIKEMDRRLRIMASQSQACEILMTIPGVGVQTSAAFAAAVDEAARFRQSRNAGVYFGLVSRRHQSGELDWTGRITKQGDSTVRKLLYEATNSILTRSREIFALKTWAMKIAKRWGLKKARVALARRLAGIMHAMLRDGTLFQA